MVARLIAFTSVEPTLSTERVAPCYALYINRREYDAAQGLYRYVLQRTLVGSLQEHEMNFEVPLCIHQLREKRDEIAHQLRYLRMALRVQCEAEARVLGHYVGSPVKHYVQ